jgi:hypothetical protein
MFVVGRGEGEGCSLLLNLDEYTVNKNVATVMAKRNVSKVTQS